MNQESHLYLITKNVRRGFVIHDCLSVVVYCRYMRLFAYEFMCNVGFSVESVMFVLVMLILTK